MAQENPLTYSDSGVNYDLMDPFKIACLKAAATTAKNIDGKFSRYGLSTIEVAESRGESAYEVEVSTDRPMSYRLAVVEEGLGTKNEIAEQMRQLQSKIDLSDLLRAIYGKSFYRTIAQDNAAMILNDLSTRGAIPLSFMLHVAAYPGEWFTDEERNADLIDGTRVACNIASCSWGGGESPTLRDIINPGHSLLSGSALGLKFSDRNGDFSERNIQEGDRIMLFGSSGPHANGITLLRTKLLERLPQGYETPLSNGQTYGEAILAPTEIYAPLMDHIFVSQARINYAVHISGHGWRKLMRPQREFTYVIDKVPEPQLIFKLIQDVSGMSNEQIYRDYNMGAGFAVFADPLHVSEILRVANYSGFQALDAGHVEAGPRRVIIDPLGVEYKGESLQIR